MTTTTTTAPSAMALACDETISATDDSKVTVVRKQYGAVSAEEAAQETLSEQVRERIGRMLTKAKEILISYDNGIQRAEEPNEVLHAMEYLSRLSGLPAQHSQLQTIIDAGLVPHIVSGLYSRDTRMTLHSLDCLMNVASGTEEQTRHCVDAGCLPVVLKLACTSRHPDVKASAFWTLGNIIGDDAKMRDHVLVEEQDLLPAVISALKDGKSIGLTLQAIFLAHNLVRGKPAPAFERIACLAKPIVKCLKASRNQEVVRDCCWSLFYMCLAPDDAKFTHLQWCLDAGMLPRILQLANMKNKMIAHPALAVLRQVCAGTDAQTQAVVDGGGVSMLVAQLSHVDAAVRTEVVCVLSNITAGTMPQRRVVIDEGGIEKFVEMLQDAQNPPGVKNEVMHALSNLFMDCDAKSNGALVDEGLLQVLVLGLSHCKADGVLIGLEAVQETLVYGKVAASERGDGVNLYAKMITEDPLCHQNLLDLANNDVARFPELAPDKINADAKAAEAGKRALALAMKIVTEFCTNGAKSNAAAEAAGVG